MTGAGARFSAARRQFSGGLLGLAISIAITALAGCSLQQDVGARADARGRGEVAPPIAGATSDGARFDSAAARGHPLVVDFWAAWCGPCRQEQPDINALHTRYGTRGVTFLGVDMRDDAAAAAAFRRDFAVPYPSIGDDGQIAAAYNVAAPPELIVIDGGGRIAQRLLGTTVGVAGTLDGLLGRGPPGGSG